MRLRLATLIGLEPTTSCVTGREQWSWINAFDALFTGYYGLTLRLLTPNRTTFSA